MVFICGILAIIVTALLANLVQPEAYRYCANVTGGLDPITNLPTPTPVKDASGRTLLAFSDQGPCLLVFDHNYPPSVPYAPAPSPNASCSPGYIPETCPLADTYVGRPTTGGGPASAWREGANLLACRRRHRALRGRCTARWRVQDAAAGAGARLDPGPERGGLVDRGDAATLLEHGAAQLLVALLAGHRRAVGRRRRHQAAAAGAQHPPVGPGARGHRPRQRCVAVSVQN